MSAASVVLDAYKFDSETAESLRAAKRKVLANARMGDGEAFAEMVLPYGPGLYRRALRLTGNSADAEDARQGRGIGHQVSLERTRLFRMGLQSLKDARQMTHQDMHRKRAELLSATEVK